MKTAVSSHVNVAVLNCCVPWPGDEENENEMMPIELLDAEFFDENSLIVVYRFRNREGGEFAALLRHDKYSSRSSRVRVHRDG